jgi:type IV pilus assembly protein PilC
VAYRFGSGVEPLAKTAAPVKQTGQMLRAGEKSDKLGEVCDRVSLFYEKKLEASIKSVMALIETLMSTVLGGIIATIAIALLPPVFKISSVIAH